MKKRIKPLPVIIVAAAILIGGIWGINESRYPNVPAFNDYKLTIRGYCAKYLVNVNFTY